MVPGYTRCSRGVAQPGSAPGWGPGGRRFKSSRPDYGHRPGPESLTDVALRSVRSFTRRATGFGGARPRWVREPHAWLRGVYDRRVAEFCVNQITRVWLADGSEHDVDANTFKVNDGLALQPDDKSGNTWTTGDASFQFRRPGGGLVVGLMSSVVACQLQSPL